MAKDQRTRKRTLELNKADRSLVARYQRMLLEYLRLNRKSYIDLIFDQFKDKDPNKDPIKYKNALLASLALFAKVNNSLVARLTTRVTDNLKKQDKRNSFLFGNKFNKLTGSDLTSVFERKNTKAALDLAIQENINLIKSLSDQLKTKLTSQIMSQVANGEIRTDKWLKDIKKSYEVSDRRAKLIVRDQSHKLLTSINRIRLENLGVESYLWRNMQDRLVRGNPNGLYPKTRYDHWSREGKEYRFDNPPADGNAGMPINCRCYMEPVITHLL